MQKFIIGKKINNNLLNFQNMQNWLVYAVNFYRIK